MEPNPKDTYWDKNADYEIGILILFKGINDKIGNMFQQPSGCWIGQVALKMNQIKTVAVQNKTKQNKKLNASVK